LSEGSFVRNVVVQIPKFDAKHNPNHNPSPNPSPNPMPIHFGQMTLWTSELLPITLVQNCGNVQGYLMLKSL